MRANSTRSDPYAALEALDAISRLDTLDDRHVETLRKLNTVPAPDWPGQRRPYVADLKAAVIKQFQPAVPDKE
ncbi:MAG: hypothetical protein WEB60_02015 [Terrimicrobiaceae bacterium]